MEVEDQLLFFYFWFWTIGRHLLIPSFLSDGEAQRHAFT